MRLDRLRLKNFRCFGDFELLFNTSSRLTVLVAENGQGKSTVLDAIRIGVWPFIKSFDLAKSSTFNDPSNSISVDDARLIQGHSSGTMVRLLPVEVELTGDWGTGTAKTWRRFREKEDRKTKTLDDDNTKLMKQWAEAVQKQVQSESPNQRDLPVFGYYGTGRLWAQKHLRDADKLSKAEEADLPIRTFGYRNCMDPASSYKHFREWFIWAWESRSNMRERQHVTDEERSNADHRIKVIQEVVDIFLKETSGWHTLEYSVEDQKSIILHHDAHGRMKVDDLSDGIRSMLAMVGDIAYRCIKLNPHLGGLAAKETYGVVLIDEVDMHLHPRWQQLVLGQLQKAFPKIQFIVTTHSPQVLSTVRQECIRVIGIDPAGNLIAEPPLARTYGEPSGTVMYAVMQVDPQPPVSEKPQLQRLTELVDQGQYESDDAVRLLDELLALLGETHPQLQRIQRSIARQKTLGPKVLKG
ncbi:AAA family ATPase [uncultured Herbaspirillum sp.]|uniref:AAA family ATPase n=1 Tax=uncultured Herbaspirillum sp. TaxID=160236 RepID=UPI00258DEE23|nr:AAA family ATPase [uncultured Herbaspirillum sp.]